MKRIFQYLVLTGVSGLLCLFLTIPANAQHRGGGGGGGHFSGGGSHFSGGGGSHFSGGGFSGARPSGGFRPQGSSVNRSGFQGNSRVTNRAVAPNRTYNRAVVTGNARIGNRAVVNGGYRGAGAARVGVGFSARYSPWRGHGGFYYNRGFYGSLYYPRLGFSLGFLPYGYYPFYWGNAEFFYDDGFFYQYNNDQYTVVEPPIGAAITSLPANAQAITINGQQYYESNGVYYQPITKDDGTVAYQVAGKDGQLDTGTGTTDNSGYTNGGNNNGNNAPAAVAPPRVGDMFYSLPPDSRKIRINGQQFLVSPDDYYYQETRDTNGSKAYKVVGTPDDAPGN
jgi:hypothetical protein